MSLSFPNYLWSLNVFDMFLIRRLQDLRGKCGSRTVCCFASTRLRQCGGPAGQNSLFWVVLGREVLKDDLQDSSLFQLRFHCIHCFQTTWTGTPGGANTNLHTIDETQPDVECSCRWALSASLYWHILTYFLHTSMILNTQHAYHATKWRYSDRTELHRTPSCFVLILRCTPAIWHIFVATWSFKWSLLCDMWLVTIWYHLSHIEHTAGKQHSKVFKPIYTLSIWDLHLQSKDCAQA